jgi:hypothetical protein
MKRIILSLVAIVIISLSSFGQAPEGFKYQAVVRDAGNVILNNQAVGMRMTIHQGFVGGTTVYQETFATTTNAYGLVNLEIGSGTVVSGDFSTIDWSTGPYFIETAVDVTGGTSYVVMGTSQLLSVPYALYAKYAGSSLTDNVDDADNNPTNELQAVSFSNDTLYLSNGGQVYMGDYGIDLVDDADADPINELQAISFSNDTLYLSNGGQLYLGDYAVDLVDDADADPTNEIQTISRTGTTVTLSNVGGTFEDSVGIYTAGEGVIITNNVVTANHSAAQAINSFNGDMILWGAPPQPLDLGFFSLLESGYAPLSTYITVFVSGKFLINYGATLKTTGCGEDPSVELSIAINGVSLTESVVSGVVGSGGCFESTSFSRSLFLVLNAGDIITVQIAVSSATCCDDAQVMNNNFSIVKM